MLKGLGPLFLPVYVPCLLLFFGQGMIVPTLPLFALTFVDSFALASLVVAATGAGTLVADLPSGLLLERMGRKRAVVGGIALSAITILGTAFAPSFGVIVLLRFLAGIGQSLWIVSLMAHMTYSTTPLTRGTALSTWGGMGRFGTFVGPAAGGLLAVLFGLRAPFYVAAALTAAAAVMALLYMREGALPPRRKGAAFAALRLLARTKWPELLAAASAVVFVQMMRNGRTVIVPLYGAAALGLNAVEVGSIISLSSAMDVVLVFPAGFIMDRFGRKFASVPACVTMAIGLALIPLTGSYLTLLLACSVIGIGNGLSAGAMFTLAADLAPPEATGEFLGVWKLTSDVGQTGGPLVVGVVADLVGFGPAAFVLAGVGLLSALIIAFFVGETKEPRVLPRAPA